ncbi:MAG: thiol-disulfide isomerase-like protein [Burkholderia sp.]|jgi:cytochrome c biogenesis protein CcmG/thiol:disulfide interchange protein DsbE|nr:thiol-disulfide isomerase-like protein [Burkholderia sp.]
MMKYHPLPALLSSCLFAFCLTGGTAQAANWKAFSTEGGQAPEPLVLADLAGRDVDLSSFKGEVVLVNFWATWCEPCREEMPSLQRLQQKLGGKGFRVLAVNVGEGAPRIRQFLERTPVSLPIVRDADSDVMKAWRVRMLPASFLVDRRGMLRYQIVGEADYDDPAQQAPVLELLK